MCVSTVYCNIVTRLVTTATGHLVTWSLCWRLCVSSSSMIIVMMTDSSVHVSNICIIMKNISFNHPGKDTLPYYLPCNEIKLLFHHLVWQTWFWEIFQKKSNFPERNVSVPVVVSMPGPLDTGHHGTHVTTAQGCIMSTCVCGECVCLIHQCRVIPHYSGIH